MTEGSTPATAIARMLTLGFKPNSLARSSDMISSAAAPTLSGLALPAVTDAALGHERRLEAPERFQARVAANALVLVHDLLAALLVAAPGRDDLVRERPLSVAAAAS